MVICFTSFTDLVTGWCSEIEKAADPGFGSAAWRLPMLLIGQQFGGLQAEVPGKAPQTRAATRSPEMGAPVVQTVVPA
jgi:hypothetical protein